MKTTCAFLLDVERRREDAWEYLTQHLGFDDKSIRCGDLVDQGIYKHKESGEFFRVFRLSDTSGLLFVEPGSVMFQFGQIVPRAFREIPDLELIALASQEDDSSD